MVRNHHWKKVPRRFLVMFLCECSGKQRKQESGLRGFEVKISSITLMVVFSQLINHVICMLSVPPKKLRVIMHSDTQTITQRQALMSRSKRPIHPQHNAFLQSTCLAPTRGGFKQNTETSWKFPHLFQPLNQLLFTGSRFF